MKDYCTREENLENVNLGGHATLRDVENGIQASTTVDGGRLELEYHPSVVSQFPKLENH